MLASSHLPVASSSGSFLITPGLGLMVWTLLLFVISMVFLARLVFPRISAALDKRQQAIEDAIDTAEETRRKADEILEEYRDGTRQPSSLEQATGRAG